MKQIFFVLAFGSLVACSGNKETTSQAPESTPAVEQVADAKQYACPMKCEGEKTYAEAGTCPVCKMELKEVAIAEIDSTGHEGHGH